MQFSVFVERVQLVNYSAQLLQLLASILQISPISYPCSLREWRCFTSNGIWASWMKSVYCKNLLHGKLKYMLI